MRTAVLLLASIAFLTSCADERYKVLDRQLETFRYEQEKQRAEDLKALYEQEAARSEELTRKILELRKELEAKETELRELEQKAGSGTDGSDPAPDGTNSSDPR
jgi:hypothetical protein